MSKVKMPPNGENILVKEEKKQYICSSAELYLDFGEKGVKEMKFDFGLPPDMTSGVGFRKESGEIEKGRSEASTRYQSTESGRG